MTRYRSLPATLLLIPVMLLLVSCAGTALRGQPPFVQVNGMSLAGKNLTLDLGVRNVNTEAIMIEHIEFSLSLNENNLSVYNAASQASVIANGTENLRFELAASEKGVALLNELESGNRNDLEYALEGVFQANEGVQMKIMRKGFIYPVPGRPGHFR